MRQILRVRFACAGSIVDRDDADVALPSIEHVELPTRRAMHPSDGSSTLAWEQEPLMVPTHAVAQEERLDGGERRGSLPVGATMPLQALEFGTFAQRFAAGHLTGRPQKADCGFGRVSSIYCPWFSHRSIPPTANPNRDLPAGRRRSDVSAIRTRGLSTPLRYHVWDLSPKIRSRASYR